MGQQEDDLVATAIESFDRAEMAQGAARRQLHAFLIGKGWTPPSGHRRPSSAVVLDFTKVAAALDIRRR